MHYFFEFSFLYFQSEYLYPFSITSYLKMIQNIKSFLGVTPEQLQKPTILKKKEDVFYLLLNTKANSFTKQFIREIHSQLDKVEANQGPTALVTASLSKLFSGGLDLKYFSHLDPEDQRYCTLETIALFGRIAVLSFPTFCLVRGGAVAGGCMFAFSHDYVYAVGKAIFSTNQAQNQLHFPPGMMEVIKKRHPFPSGLRDMIVFARQFQAEEALEYKFIDGILKEEDAVKFAHKKASEVSYLGDNKECLKKIKSELHRQLVQSCFHKQINPNVVSYVKMKSFPKL